MEAETAEYKNMIVQGLMMNVWYDQNVTLESLRELKAVDDVL